ncbi:MAG: deoxyguanosinetriphosphate triphosphohydrolase [Clostridia bacterium]|nr:deoxyguanosinetriphosphate triphosphohydrolase [Clostridia bacterium]
MLPREIVEEREERDLSPLAALSKHTKGRRRPEKLCEVRAEFQRDRDRIIHSKSFRRLKHKTQVFIAPEGDHYRTRLTHTLEVSQIARTIARGLRLNEDLTEAIALGHDLGHTPFGHAGEMALNQIHEEGFKHNEQSLRIVDELEEGKGLNLTWEVRDGILHHTGDTDPATLEGQVVKVADRIAYINHDIDDAVRGGVIQPDQLPKDCLAVLGRDRRERINTMVTDLILHNRDRRTIAMSPEVNWATEELRRFLYDHVYVGSIAKKEEGKAIRLVQDLYRFFMDHPSFLPPEYAPSSPGELARRVCDYIAGMTDRYAVSLYIQLFVPEGFKM